MTWSLSWKYYPHFSRVEECSCEFKVFLRLLVHLATPHALQALHLQWEPYKCIALPFRFTQISPGQSLHARTFAFITYPPSPIDGRHDQTVPETKEYHGSACVDSQNDSSPEVKEPLPWYRREWAGVLPDCERSRSPWSSHRSGGFIGHLRWASVPLHVDGIENIPAIGVS